MASMFPARKFEEFVVLFAVRGAGAWMVWMSSCRLLGSFRSIVTVLTVMLLCLLCLLVILRVCPSILM